MLRQQFKLNHEVTRPEIHNQIQWIVAHPSYIQKLAQAEPYIYHIVTELKKRKLPGEIALIPMIESAYDPFAYSGAGAAGLWQLMPGTGTGLGLKQDWWYDGRRSVRPATDAALNYLAYLNKLFNGDWLLAFAAYDSGEGTIARLIKRSHQRRNIRFWSLPVPRETKAYIPRLLALAAIIQNPQRYHVSLPDIPHMPYFEEVNIGSQIDLNHAAKLAGISYKELIQLNPGYNRWTTAPYRPYKLLIPINKVHHFTQNLANLPEKDRVNWTRHTVTVGDSLARIAQKYHTTVKLIKELNQLKTNAVRSGQLLLVPSHNMPLVTALKPSSAPNQTTTLHPKDYKVVHIVQKKDTYAGLVKQYRVSEQAIRRWNLLGPDMPLRRGQQLIIWKQPHSGQYTIKLGDNLSAIAKRFHTTVTTLMQLNPQLNKHLLHPGQQIRLG